MWADFAPAPPPRRHPRTQCAGRREDAMKAGLIEFEFGYFNENAEVIYDNVGDSYVRGEDSPQSQHGKAYLQTIYSDFNQKQASFKSD